MSATIDVRSLADFKRFLAQPGATIRVVRNDIAEASGNAEWIANIAHPRTVAKLQTNAVAFRVGVLDRLTWHYFGKAGQYDFDGAEVVYQPKAGGGLIVYSLSISAASHASA